MRILSVTALSLIPTELDNLIQTILLNFIILTIITPY